MNFVSLIPFQPTITIVYAYDIIFVIHIEFIERKLLLLTILLWVFAQSKDLLPSRTARGDYVNWTGQRISNIDDRALANSNAHVS